MQNYLGKLLNEDIDADIAFKIYWNVDFIAAREYRDTKFAEVKEEHWPAVYATPKRHLTVDAKFINGDLMTTHDFTVGGFLTNHTTGSNSKGLEVSAECHKSVQARMLKYIEDI
jgi:hypothetical protein